MKKVSISSESLVAWLAVMERRRRAWMLFATAPWLVLVCAIITAVLVAIDRWFPLPTVVRAVAAGLTVVWALRFAGAKMIAAFRSIDPVLAARYIELMRPTLEERLVTLASRASDIDPRIGCRLRDEIKSILIARPLPVVWAGRKSILVALAAASLTAGLLLASRRANWAASEKRILRPWVMTPAASSATLSLTATTTVLKRGDATVTLDARVHGSSEDETVLLHVIDSLGETDIVMTPQGQNRFTRTLSRLLQSVDVYATTAELRSRAVHLTIGPKPSTR